MKSGARTGFKQWRWRMKCSCLTQRSTFQTTESATGQRTRRGRCTIGNRKSSTQVVSLPLCFEFKLTLGVVTSPFRLCIRLCWVHRQVGPYLTRQQLAGGMERFGSSIRAIMGCCLCNSDIFSSPKVVFASSWPSFVRWRIPRDRV